MSWISRLFSSGTHMAPSSFVSRDPQVPVLDVRTPGEFSGGHVEGALNVDVMDRSFEDRIRALERDGVLRKEAPIYLYCRSGNRSGKAASSLQHMGFSNAVNVGGLEPLRAAGAKVAE